MGSIIQCYLKDLNARIMFYLNNLSLEMLIREGHKVSTLAMGGNSVCIIPLHSDSRTWLKYNTKSN